MKHAMSMTDIMMNAGGITVKKLVATLPTVVGILSLGIGVFPG